MVKSQQAPSGSWIILLALVIPLASRALKEVFLGFLTFEGVRF